MAVRRFPEWAAKRARGNRIIGLVLFKVHVVGSYVLLFIVVALGAFTFLGLGFTISGVAKTTDAVPVFANLTVFPMMFAEAT